MRLLCLAAVIAMTGCSHLSVSKVPTDRRLADKDGHIKGFRYYLSRPYVLVKNPVHVSTETSLLIVPRCKFTHGLEGYLDAYIARSGSLSQADAKTLADGIRNIESKLDRNQASARSVVGLTDRHDFAADARRSTGGQFGVSVIADGVSGSEKDVNTKADDGSETASSPGTHLAASSMPAEGKATVPQLSAQMEIVFLPDMDEQYAVHPCNVMAKSSYAMSFKDGWQLNGVNGEFDSTTVALELLKTIDHAIETAKSLATGSVDAGGGSSGGAGGSDLGFTDSRVHAATSNEVIFEVIRERTIAPGLYRINKPWEVEGGAVATCGSGMLGKLGLEPVDSIVVRLAKPKSAPVRETDPGCKPCAPSAADKSGNGI